ncbi:hypothetical protein EDC04DRAFT_2614325 [Pisolithus marmoratus]|nr:hypothetical protein EDC04DRAFT_2614325 [Pisolithus marmoratus]
MFWSKSISGSKDTSSKAMVGQVMACRDSFTQAAQTWCNVDSIHAQGIFAGSMLCMQLEGEKQMDISRLLDYLATIVKYKVLDSAASIPLPNFIVLSQTPYDQTLALKPQESRHDHNCCKLYKVNLVGGQRNVPWQTLLDVLYASQYTVIDWPSQVPAVGPDFNIRCLNADHEPGKVKTGWLRLYQNNFAQVGHPPPKPPTTPPAAPTRATPPSENVPESELSKLCQEITKLREKLLNYITSHKACCAHHSKSPSNSSEEDDAPSATHPPPILLSLQPNGSAEPVVNPPSWLITATTQQDLPTTFKDCLVIPSPIILSSSFPTGTLEVIKLNFDGASPPYMGTHQDGELRVSTTAQCGQVSTTYNLPHDPSIPMLPRRRK